ncbi:hypothetical protein AAG906_020363 [Vitis piasezkii]
MILALNSKNKLGFVNGSIKAPSEEIDPEGYATWSRCNDMFGKISVSDSLRVMRLASLKFSEILLVFDKSNSLSRLLHKIERLWMNGFLQRRHGA